MQILGPVEEIDLVQILQLHQLVAGQIVSANAVLAAGFTQEIVVALMLRKQRVLDGNEANVDVLADIAG